MLEIGERLATHGYYVLLPDLYYRSGPYEPMDPHTVFTDPAKRKTLMEKFLAFATQANIMSDTRAFLDRLYALLEFTLPLYEREGKSSLTLALGCTGGRHRSVVLVENLRQRLSRGQLRIHVKHRDIDK